MFGFLLLRITHIVITGLWVGGACFVAFFLMPTLRAIGPNAGAVMQHLTQVRRLPVYMMVLTWGTLLSGGGLMWHDAGTLGSEWFRQGQGQVFGFGAAVAIVAALIGMLVSSPTAKKLGDSAGEIQRSGVPPTAAMQAQMAGLQMRLAKAVTLVAVLVLIAAAAMACARYVA